MEERRPEEREAAKRRGAEGVVEQEETTLCGRRP